MPLLRRKPKPPVAVALWTTAPKLRPLRKGEQLELGQVVYVEGEHREYRFHAWLPCGPVNYAILDIGSVYGWPVRHEDLLRVVDDGQPSGKGGKR